MMARWVSGPGAPFWYAVSEESTDKRKTLQQWQVAIGTLDASFLHHDQFRQADCEER